MKHTIQRMAAVFAAAIMTTTVAKLPELPVPVLADGDSLLDFAQQIAGHRRQGDVFAEMQFYPEQASMICDGKNVGQQANGFVVRGGEILIDKEAVLTAAERNANMPMQDTVTLEEAQRRIGLETFVDEQTGAVTVSSPYQTAALVVKAGGNFDPQGGVEIAGGYQDLHVLQYETPADAYQACQILNADAAVQYAEPNRIYSVLSDECDIDSDNWGYEVVGAAEFLDPESGAALTDAEIVVAVIDTGIYEEHNLFRGRIAEGAISLTGENNGIADHEGHGTHCAGILCSVTPENVRILPVKAMDQYGYGSSAEIYCAMMYASEHADVVNMSLGGTGVSPLLCEAAEVLRQLDIPCVVAAGNESRDVRFEHPANIDSCITVSSVSMNCDLTMQNLRMPDSYVLSSFSNYGSGVDFAAPGSGIRSAGLENPDSMIIKNGTSMAAPFVAGCFASLLCHDPDYSTETMYTILKNNTLDLGAPGFDDQFGWGMVQLRSLQFSENAVKPPTISVPAGRYNTVQKVTLFSSTMGAQVYYSLDDSEPVLYTGDQIEIAHSLQLKAYCVLDGEQSPPLIADYQIVSDMPAFSYESGCYDGPIAVYLYAMDDAEIYYTLDGSIPSPENGTLLTGEYVLVSETSVLRTVAVTGDVVSDVHSEGYLIDGKSPEKMLEIENGVLKKVYCTAPELDLTAMSLPEPVIEIGARAMAYVAVDTVVLPDTVRKIGECAFQGCSLLSIEAHGVTEIGKDAFAGSELQWAYFGQITSLESGAFSYCEDLKYLYAEFSLIQDIPDELFCYCKELEVNLPWEQLISIGDYAFENCMMPAEIHLDSLVSMGDSAFSETKGLSVVTISERLRELPDQAFYQTNLRNFRAMGIEKLGNIALCQEELHSLNLELDWDRITSISCLSLANCEVNADLCLPALTELRGNAFKGFQVHSLSLPAMKTLPAYALNELYCDAVYLENAEILEDNSLCTNARIVFGSHLCGASDYAFHGDTDIYAPAESNIRKFHHFNDIRIHSEPEFFVPETSLRAAQNDTVQLRAYPMGVQMEMTWYASEKEGGKGTPCGTGYSLTLDSVQPGTYYYYAEASANGTVCCVSPYITVQIDAQKENGKLDPEQSPYLLTVPLEGEVIYGYTPKVSGDYYIFAEDPFSSAELNVYENGVCLADNETESEDGELHPVTLKAGVSYQVKITMTGESRHLRLFIQQEKPKTYEGYINISMPSFVHPSELDHLDSLLTVTFYDPDTDIQTELDQDAYTAFVNRENNLLEVFMRQAPYLSSHAFYNLTEELEFGDGNLEIDVSPEQSVSYRFTVPESGFYCFYTDFSDETYEEFANCAKIPRELSYNYSILLLHHGYNVTHGYTDNGICVLEDYLVAGETYVICLNRNSDTFVPMKLCISSGKKNIFYADCQMQYNADYEEGIPEIAISYQDEELTEGEDYEKIIVCGKLLGESYVLVRGIGEYCGCLTDSFFFSLESDDVDSVALDEPFTVTTARNVLELTVPTWSAVKLTRITGEGDYVSGIYTYQESLKGILHSDQAIWLSPGSYYLILTQDSDAAAVYQLTVADMIQMMSFVEIDVRPGVYNGELQHPQIHANYEGRELKEGVDYIISYPEMREPGMYQITVYGKGSFIGTASISYQIVPSLESEYPEMKGAGNRILQIKEPGTSSILHWYPEKPEYCLRVYSEAYCTVRVYTVNREYAGECSGFGEMYCELNVRSDADYYIIAEYPDNAYTGTVQVELLEDYYLLQDCDCDLPAEVPVQISALPAFTVRCGEENLREGVDYEVRYCFGVNVAGRGEICLKGLGKYVGEKVHTFYSVPEVELTAFYVPELELDADYYEYELNCPGTIRYFRFTADKSGDYYVSAPTSDRNGAETFLFKNDTELIARGCATVHLEANESVLLVCVTDTIESDFESNETYQLMVSMKVPDQFWTDGKGMKYLIKNGEACLVDCQAKDLYAIDIPSAIVLPGSDKEIPVTQIAPNPRLKEMLFYLERGSAAAEFCTEHAAVWYAYRTVQEKIAGDVNGDGFVSEIDAVALQYWLTEATGASLDDLAYDNADFNGDGSVDLSDVLDILAYHSAQYAD